MTFYSLRFVLLAFFFTHLSFVCALEIFQKKAMGSSRGPDEPITDHQIAFFLQQLGAEELKQQAADNQFLYGKKINFSVPFFSVQQKQRSVTADQLIDQKKQKAFEPVLVCNGKGEWRMVTVQKGYMCTEKVSCIVCLDCEDVGKQRLFDKEGKFKEHVDIYHSD